MDGSLGTIAEEYEHSSVWFFPKELLGHCFTIIPSFRQTEAARKKSGEGEEAESLLC